MVDFNSGEVLNISAGDIYKLLIIQRRYDFMEALERYTSQCSRSVVVPDDVLKGRLWNYYLEIEPLYNDDNTKKNIKNQIGKANNPETYRDVATLLSDFVIKQRILTTVPRMTGRVPSFKKNDKGEVEEWEPEPTE